MSDTASDVVVGDVVRTRIGAGSKSDHDAVVVDTGSQTLLLRRRGGNAYLSADKLHMNDEGYEHLASQLAATCVKSLAL